jgi:hypothetical protein
MPSSSTMAKTITTLLFFLLLGGVTITMCEDEEREEGSTSKNLFLMQNSKSVVKTHAGELRLFRNNDDRFLDRHMHIGLLNMEPRSLFIPQYLDSNLIIFVRRGIVLLFFINMLLLSLYIRFPTFLSFHS